MRIYVNQISHGIIFYNKKNNLYSFFENKMHKNFKQICIYFTPTLYIVILRYHQLQPIITRAGMRNESTTTERLEIRYTNKKSSTYFLNLPLFK